MPRRSTSDAPTPGSAADQQPDADPAEVARTILLRKLSAAPRTRAQLADALRQRAVPDAVARRALDRFTELGYIDDAAFADAWVRTRQEGRGLARRALAHELRKKGVDDEIAHEALAAVDPGDERAAAARLVRKRLPSLQRQPTEVAVRRLVGMLARKGYSANLALAVVREELRASDQEIQPSPTPPPTT